MAKLLSLGWRIAAMDELAEKEAKQPQSEASPVLSFTRDFFLACTRLEKAQQTKVLNFWDKFVENPRSPGINYEKLRGSRDDKVRSVRIDQQYRAIVITPEEGNVYLMVWVDKEEEAYQWALRRTFERGEDSNEVIITTQLEIEDHVRSQTEQSPEGPLKECDNDTLISFGVPPILLPSVRAIADADGFGLLRPYLSQECVEALTWLAYGLPVADVREYVLTAASENEAKKNWYVAVDRLKRRAQLIDFDPKKLSELEICTEVLLKVLESEGDKLGYPKWNRISE
jgi:hypothetical protein